MSPRRYEPYSTPASSSKGHDEAGTPSTSAWTTPPTPQSQEPQHSAQGPFAHGLPLVTPNDIRRSSTSQNDHGDPSTGTHRLDESNMDEQARIWFNALQAQDQKYLMQIRDLERGKTNLHDEIERLNARLKAKEADPTYVTDLENAYQELWDSKEVLSAQVEEFKLENKKLQDINAYQQQEIDHIQKESALNSAAINLVRGNQKDQFNAKNADLREQLDFAREENADLYERCTMLEQENEQCKTQHGISTALSDKLKLVKINKNAILYEEELAKARMDLGRLHDELDRCIQPRMHQEGTMLFDAYDIKAEFEMQQQIIEDLKTQNRKQQDQIDELSITKVSSRSPDLMTELENAENFSEAGSIVAEIARSHNRINKELEHDEASSHDRNLRKDLQHAEEQLRACKTHIHELTNYISELTSTPLKTGPKNIPIPQEPLITFKPFAGSDRDIANADTEEIIIKSIEDSHSQLEEKKNEIQNAEPKTWGQWIRSVGVNLWDGLDHDQEDIIKVSFSSASSETVEPNIPRNKLSQDGLQISSISKETPSRSSRLWAEILWFLCASHEYWATTEVVIKDDITWIKIRGPWWWSSIVQLLMFMLVPGVTIAWWCIMTASAERELWLDANEITFKKYWDTTIWGAERDLIWRLCYGLGFV